MSDLTGSAAGEDESDGSSPTLRDFTAASNEVHMLAKMTAAMMEAQQPPSSSGPAARQADATRRNVAAGAVADTVSSSPTASGGDIESPGERTRRRRTSSRTRLRPPGSVSVTAAAGALLERIRQGGSHASQRSATSSATSGVRTGHRLLPAEPPGTTPVGMTTLRQHVEELSAQLKYARAKQETDAKVIQEMETENARLKNLVESAGEVSDAAAASLRELARSRRTVEDLRNEAEGMQRRAQEAEERCEHLQQLLRDTEQRLGEVEQRAASARAQDAERASARAGQALDAANERVQNAERRAARAEQVASQEQARAVDACQRAARAEAAAKEDHERALDAERRAARAEHLLEELQEQALELERQVARAEQLLEAEAARVAEADRRAARAEQLLAQERERSLAAERRAARVEDEAEQARALAVAADRRASLVGDAVEEEKSRADAAERRAARAEQAAEEARQLTLEAERRAVRMGQAQEDAERRLVRAEQAHEEALARLEDAERRASRAAQSLESAEARAVEAERRAGRAEQAQQDALARLSESERRLARAEQSRDEVIADMERRMVRAEQAADEARNHATEMEKRAVRAEQIAHQDRQKAVEAERQVACMEQALQEAQEEALTAERRTVRAEQAEQEARARAEEVRTLAAQAEANASRLEQLLAQERDRAQEEARHAARMENASMQDQERAREADERAAAAIARAQQAETRLAVAEGHTAALETRLQQALSYADAADARAVDAERRYDRLAADSRELHAAVLHLTNSTDVAMPLPAPRPRTPIPQDRDRSPRHVQWLVAPSGASAAQRKLLDETLSEQLQDLASPRRVVLFDADGSRRPAGDADEAAAASSSTPTGAGPNSGTRIRLWADAYATPSPDPSSTGKDGQKSSAKGWGGRSSAARKSADPLRSSDGGARSARMDPLRQSSPSRLVQAAGHDIASVSGKAAGFVELYMESSGAVADELRHVRAELRSTRHELNDLKSRYGAACSRVQLLEEQAANAEKLKAKIEKLASQARKSEHLAAELKVCRAQLAEMEGLQLDLRKAQAELAEAQGQRAALEDARAQLVEMDRVRAEARRVNALLQTVTRERDAARSELEVASAQSVSVAALKAQLQRVETALTEAEQGREEARAATAAALGQQEKLRAQVSTAEEELGEALRRCARLQAAADEASHQRDRLQAALEGAEGALQTADAERAVLAAAQDRTKSKLQELADLQEEIRLLKSQLQESITTQRRASQAEEHAKARAEDLQKQIVTLKAQVAEAAAAQVEAASLQSKLEQAVAQVQTMKADLGAAADRLEGHTKLQADHAATVERAEKAESQLRTATEAGARANEQLEQLQHELAETRRSLAKTKEELAMSTSLASSRGARVAELEHEVVVLREKAYQLDVEVASMTTELHRLKANLASASEMIEEATSERNQLSRQLSDVSKQQARGVAAATAAEERLKADMQQLQVRLASSEAEFRAVQHANGTLHDDLERARSEILTLQNQLKEEYRHREDHAGECRRLQRELETVTESLAQAQRSHRSAAATSTELEEELERLRPAHAALEAEMQVANGRLQRLQEDVRQLSDRNTELSQQLHSLSSTVRQLEAENARLNDGHATLTVEMEVRAAEARAARGEAAELAADRARLMAELDAARAERPGHLARSPSLRSTDPRITITGGGIPPVSDARGASGVPAETPRPVPFPRHLGDEFVSPIPSPNGRADNLQALLAAPIDTGAILSGAGDLSQYEALLAALDEEAQQLDEELAGKEASSSVLLQRMRATKQAITARMETLQVALQSARDAESEMRRQAADKDATIQKLQQQLAQLGGGAAYVGTPHASSGEVAAAAGPGGAASPLGFGTDMLQGNMVISALRQDLDAAHERLRDAGRQLREAQHRAESAEAEVDRHRHALADAKAEVARLQTELTANDRVLAEAESALVVLVGEKETLERNLDGARQAERLAAQTTERLRAQVAALHARLEIPSAPATALEAEMSNGTSGAVYDRMINYLQSLGNNVVTVRPSEGGRDQPSGAGPTASTAPVPLASSPESIPNVRMEVAPASVPTARRRYAAGPHTSESGSTQSAFRQGNPNGDFWEASSTSGWDNSAAGSLGGAAVALPARMLLSQQEGAGMGRKGPNVNMSSALYQHAPLTRLGIRSRRGSGAQGVDADGPASLTASPATTEDLEGACGSGRNEANRRTDNAIMAYHVATGGSPTHSPRAGPTRNLSGSSAAGLIMKARANWAAAAAKSAIAEVVRPSSPLSPSGLRSQRSLVSISPQRSGVATVGAVLNTPYDKATAAASAYAAAAAMNSTGSESLQRRSTQALAETQLDMPPTSPLLRPCPAHSTTPHDQAHACSSPDNRSDPSPRTAADNGASIYMARPAATSDAKAALQSSAYRLTPVSTSNATTNVACQQRDNSMMKLPGTASLRQSISIGSPRGSGSPMVSPRGLIAQRSLCRAVEVVGRTLAMTGGNSVGSVDQPADVAANPGHGERLHPSLAREDVQPGLDTAENAPPSVKTVTQDSLSRLPRQTSSPPATGTTVAVTGVSRPLPDDDGSSSLTCGGSVASVASTPVNAGNVRRRIVVPALSISDTGQTASYNHSTRSEQYAGSMGTKAATWESRHPDTTASEPVAHGELILRRQYRGLATPEPQTGRREVTPASLRRAAGQDEGSSMLTKRLAAMDDALRAIGAL